MDEQAPVIGPQFDQLINELAETVGPQRREQARRLHAALMLAPTLQICERLLAGERIHKSLLDPNWVKRLT